MRPVLVGVQFLVFVPLHAGSDVVVALVDVGVEEVAGVVVVNRVEVEVVEVEEEVGAADSKMSF